MHVKRRGTDYIPAVHAAVASGEWVKLCLNGIMVKSCMRFY